ncbi:MAG TPA: hypothetical protein VES19_15550 [Candidatus Limnocylindrales bacterium]|nr:hypothetical protein [Candidatus Limnocylindrales bacterium]
MYPIPSGHAPIRTVDDTISTLGRPLGPPVAVITVIRGVDPRARRDPAALDDASPYFATSSEPPRTP